MPAPKGNQFWKLRSKHGRDAIFSSPEELKQACYEYFEHQSKQKWERVDFRGKDNKRIRIPVSSPFSLSGLCIYLGVNTKYFNDFEKTCSKDFSEVITHVKEVIYTQKFEGATVGIYNANIIARDLGLIDKQDLTTAGEKITRSPEEVEARIQELLNKRNRKNANRK